MPKIPFHVVSGLQDCHVVVFLPSLFLCMNTFNCAEVEDLGNHKMEIEKGEIKPKPPRRHRLRCPPPLLPMVPTLTTHQNAT